MVKDLVAAGTTVLLTTQYLEEADRLADRVGVINEGRIISEGTADELKAGPRPRHHRGRCRRPGPRRITERAGPHRRRQPDLDAERGRVRSPRPKAP